MGSTGKKFWNRKRFLPTESCVATATTTVGSSTVVPPHPQPILRTLWEIVRTHSFVIAGFVVTWSPLSPDLTQLDLFLWVHFKGRFTHSMPCPCRAHAVPLPCRAAKGLECVFPISFTQCGRVWFTLAMPRPCHALTMPFFSRPRHSTAVERRPVGYLPAFGFFWLPRRIPRRLLSEAYHPSLQRSIPTTVKNGSSILQKRWSVKLLD